MNYVIGIVVIVVGIGQILLRGRIARANAASNSAMFNGRMGGKGFVAYNQGVAILVGIIFVAFGVALLVGAFHLGSHH
jgi:hypothetical protein